MRESRAPGLLVGRADVVPHVDRDDRNAGVAMQDHVETVRERELPIGDLKGSRRLRAQRDGYEGEQNEQNAATHGASCHPILYQLHLSSRPKDTGRKTY